MTVNESRIELLKHILSNEKFKKNHPLEARKYEEELQELLELSNHGEKLPYYE